MEDSVKLDLTSTVQDHRSVPLRRLAVDCTSNADSLQHVLPAQKQDRVSVASFGSCI